ncbi:MAG TPA: hypothetical protein VFU21_20095 [Kofleriaceae bacterium]|nr:hypothetical protein [Kofleriaceae bacterium]
MIARRTILLLLAALVGLSSAPAPADAGGERTARRLKRSALAHYRDGDYESAARDFRAAYEIEADPELLYALGQALRLAGDCAGAIDAYQDFLITDPDEQQAAAAREKIEVCRQVVAPAAAPPPPRPARRRAIARPLPAPAAPARRPARSWVRDPAGGILLAGGLSAAATGLWLRGSSTEDPRAAGTVLLAAGGGLAAAAIVRYALVRHARRDDDRPSVAASVDPGGGGAIWVTGRF